ncbi:hypothetical protein H696_00029 [Fonticula alba]|uniref:Uncharacterized protein n=1 Tax=Fonticula alba TaxID=691883 RepID=A0A058ZER8_FONAL|nr:hypothetical protein H696_00029 [Fonticula alba]KCV72441.1 hypothetical protein H696_00029 [Fonticula alba]|eukprot:XP_009492142.1 hypothetical protein H696_00029 [Fonticula alba]
MIRLADGTEIAAIGEVQLTLHCGGKTARGRFVVLAAAGGEVFLGLHTMQKVWPERWSWWTDEVSTEPVAFWQPARTAGPENPSYAVVLRSAGEVDEMRTQQADIEEWVLGALKSGLTTETHVDQ